MTNNMYNSRESVFGKFGVTLKETFLLAPRSGGPRDCHVLVFSPVIGGDLLSTPTSPMSAFPANSAPWRYLAVC